MKNLGRIVQDEYRDQLKAEQVFVGYPDGSFRGDETFVSEAELNKIADSLRHVVFLDPGIHREPIRFEVARLVIVGKEEWDDHVRKGRWDRVKMDQSVGPLMLATAQMLKDEISLIGYDFQAFIRELEALIDRPHSQRGRRQRKGQ